MTLAAIEYTAENVDQMLADYAARRRRLYQPAPKAPPPAPKLVVIDTKPEPEPAPDPLAQYRLAYDSALDPKWGVQVAKRILRETAAEHGFTVAEIQSDMRRAPLARARQLTMWRIAKMTRLSMPHIAKIMGDRDHTTVLHAVRRINGILGENVRSVGKWRGSQQ